MKRAPETPTGTADDSSTFLPASEVGLHAAEQHEGAIPTGYLGCPIRWEAVSEGTREPYIDGEVQGGDCGQPPKRSPLANVEQRQSSPPRYGQQPTEILEATPVGNDRQPVTDGTFDRHKCC